jgi:integrase
MRSRIPRAIPQAGSGSWKTGMSVYKRGHVYWISYYFNGQQVREGVSGSRREAEAALETRKTDIRRGQFRHIPKRERLMFDGAAKEYRAAKAGKRSLRRDETSLRRLREAFRLKRLDQITAQDIADYKKKRAGQVSGATVNRELALLKCLFNVAIAAGHVAQNPVKAVKFFPESAKRRDKVLSNLEIEHLIEAAAPHLRPILAVALFTGLRKGDILALRPEDIDFERRIVRLTAQKTAEAIEIPMHPILERILRGVLASSDEPRPYVFMSSRASRTTGQWTRFTDVKNAFRGALERSGLAGQGFCFHDLRRTFASTLYRSGVPLLTVSRLLGHRSVKTTERYLGVKLEEKRQAVAVLGTEWGPATSTIQAQLAKTEPVKSLPSAS